MPNSYRIADIQPTGRIGTVYLLHLDPAYAHCRHYIGFTERPIEQRIGEHWAGNGSGLTSAAVAAGCTLVLARTWAGVDAALEFRLKCRAESPRLCPICNPQGWQRLASIPIHTRKGE